MKLEIQSLNRISSAEVGDFVTWNRNFWMVSVLGLAAIGCAAEEDLCSTGNRLTVVREELKDSLIEQMRVDGVAAHLSEGGDICYPAREADYVRSKLIALDLEQRPAGRVTIQGGEYGQRVLAALTEEAIEFSHFEENGKVVILVAQHDRSRLREIAARVADSMIHPRE